jgi:hypothetical protein
MVSSLGRCSHREAVLKGTIKHAEVLRGLELTASLRHPAAIQPPSPPEGPRLRDVYERWKASKPRSPDSVNTCLRSVILFEEFTGNPPIDQLSREQGDGFRTWLQHPDRKTTSKTARDRLTWVKSVLKFAFRDLELLDRNPWKGIDITFKTTNKRRPWTDDELKTTILMNFFFDSIGANRHHAACFFIVYWSRLL